MHVSGISHLFGKSVCVCVCVYLQFTKRENEALSHPCAFGSAAGARLRKRRREGPRGMERKKGRRGEEKRGRKAWRGVEREALSA